MIKLPERAKVPLNFLLYNLTWVVAVVGASKGQPLLGPIVAGAFVVIHLLILKDHWKNELQFIIATVLIGSLLDSPLSRYGYVVFNAPDPSIVGSYPIWMSSLWAGFAATLSLSLSWMKGRYLIGALFGAIGGPASLYAGVRLGAANFQGDELNILLFSAFEWSIAIPVVLYLHKKLMPNKS
jgi:hypothetical protein